MLLAINKNLVGKPAPEVTKQFNHTFAPVDLSIEKLADVISLGFAFCPQFNNGRRQNVNFKISGYLAVDIDHGLTLEAAQASEFYQNYASLLYTTASHTAQAHRFRVIFELENPITDPDTMKAALTGLISKFGGDQSCTDACRIFFGSVGCVPILQSKKLPQDIVEELIIRGRESAVRSDNRNDKNAPQTTVASRLHLPADTKVQTEAGAWELLKDLPERTRVHCPQHIDNRPSAFVLRSRIGVPGVHCKSCNATFFLERAGGNVPYRYEFDYSWNRVLNLSYEEYSTYADENGNIDLSELRGGEIRVSAARFLEFDEVFPGHPRAVSQQHLAELAEAMVFDDLPDFSWDITFVKSPKGSGKTEWLRRLVAMQRAQGRSVLLIGHRRALINSTSERLGLTSYIKPPAGLQRSNLKNLELFEQGAVSGEDAVKQPSPDIDSVGVSYLEPTTNYAICMDSLPARLNTIVDKYDVVVIDEVEQVFSHLLSRTMRLIRREVLLFLRHYLRAAKEVYLLDADLNRVTVEVLDTLLDDDRERRWRALINRPIVDSRLVHLYTSPRKDVLVGELAAALSRGERCFVATNSRSWTDNLVPQLEKKCGVSLKAIVVSSNNSQSVDIQRFLRDIKTEALNYQLIVATPSMGTGIDISFSGGEQKIDAVFGFFETRINTHFDIDQQLSRVRNPKRINVWIAPETYAFECDPAVIESEIETMHDEFSELIDITLNGKKIYAKRGLADTLYAAIYASVSAMRRASMNDLRRNFIQLRESAGWKVVTEDGNLESARSGRSIQNARKAGAKAARYQRILDAERLSNEDYFDLKKEVDERLNDRQRDAMERYAIESFYLCDVTRELLDGDDAGALRRSVRMYQLMMTPEEVLKKLDRTEEVNLFLDRTKRLITKALLADLFTATGLLHEGMFDSSIEISNVGLQQFADLCIANKPRVEELLNVDVRTDVQKKPVQQLGACLNVLGLKLTRSRVKQVSGSKQYFYELDKSVLEQVSRWADVNVDRERRSAWIESRKHQDDIATHVTSIKQRTAGKSL